ncbi:MAG: hypothetical protein ACTSXK_05490 [Promethearchaeota archaeon]
MDKNNIIDELDKFITILENNNSNFSHYIFYRYMVEKTKLKESNMGEFIVILQSNIEIPSCKLNLQEIHRIFSDKIRSNMFLMPSDSNFTEILNYFFANREKFLMETGDLISFLNDKISFLQKSFWVEQNSIYSFGNSMEPDCVINLMAKNKNIAFVFQINNLIPIFTKSTNNSVSLKSAQSSERNREENEGISISAEITKQEDKIKLLSEKIKTIKKESDVKIEQLNNGIHQLSEENAKLSSENEKLISENRDLTNLSEKLKLDNQKLNEENNDISTRNINLKEELKKTKKNLSKISEEIKELKKEKSRLIESNERLSTQNHALKERITEKISKIKDILNEIDNFKSTEF